MSDLKGIHIQKWDGKKESFDKFDAQVQSVAVLLGCENALDESLMRTCPTDTAYAGYDLANPGNNADAIKIYQDNKKMCALLVLAQGSSHGLAMINKTKGPDKKYGRADQIMKTMKKKYAPEDVGATIELELALDKIPFKFANDYYNQVVATTAMYGCTLDEKQLCVLAAKKCRSALYVKLILDHVKG